MVGSSTTTTVLIIIISPPLSLTPLLSYFYSYLPTHWHQWGDKLCNVTVSWDVSPESGVTYTLHSQVEGGASSTSATTDTSFTVTELRTDAQCHRHCHRHWMHQYHQLICTDQHRYFREPRCRKSSVLIESHFKTIIFSAFSLEFSSFTFPECSYFSQFANCYSSEGIYTSLTLGCTDMEILGWYRYRSLKTI